MIIGVFAVALVLSAIALLEASELLERKDAQLLQLKLTLRQADHGIWQSENSIKECKGLNN